MSSSLAFDIEGAEFELTTPQYFDRDVDSCYQDDLRGCWDANGKLRLRNVVGDQASWSVSQTFQCYYTYIYF